MQNLVRRQTKFNSYKQHDNDERHENIIILLNAQALSSSERNSDLKTDGMQATEPKKEKN